MRMRKTGLIGRVERKAHRDGGEVYEGTGQRSDISTGSNFMVAR